MQRIMRWEVMIQQVLMQQVLLWMERVMVPVMLTEHRLLPTEWMWLLMLWVPWEPRQLVTMVMSWDRGEHQTVTMVHQRHRGGQGKRKHKAQRDEASRVEMYLEHYHEHYHEHQRQHKHQLYHQHYHQHYHKHYHQHQRQHQQHSPPIPQALPAH